MIEPEIAFANLDDDMDLAEDYLKYCLRYVLVNNADDIQFFTELETDAKAKAEGAKVEAEAERDDVLGELEQLANENADLHKSCDFTLKNFEIRQTARDEEVEALKQSIAMFSGASFSAFLSKEA